MRDPEQLRTLTAIWFGLLFAPVTVGVSLGLLPAGTFKPALDAAALQWLQNPNSASYLTYDADPE